MSRSRPEVWRRYQGVACGCSWVRHWFDGFPCFRPWGKAASWFGAFLPLTIRGLNLCLTLGQFSAACVGLLTLQWLLLQRQKPLPAGLCWALAMIKPQIAVTFALSLLPKYRKGLWLGSGILAGLSVVALWHTGTQPIDFLMSWLQTLKYIAGEGSSGSANLTGIFTASQQDPKAMAMLLLATAATIFAGIYIAIRHFKSIRNTWNALMRCKFTLELAGISAISGGLLFYHGFYDNIMLYPALLCCWRASFKRPALGNAMLSILITFSLSAPVSLTYGFPAYKTFQTSVCLLAGIVFLLRLLNGKAESIAPAN